MSALTAGSATLDATPQRRDHASTASPERARRHPGHGRAARRSIVGAGSMRSRTVVTQTAASLAVSVADPRRLTAAAPGSATARRQRC